MSPTIAIRQAVAAISVALVAASGVAFSAAAPASADVPPAPVAQFGADLCQGSTWMTPTAIRADDSDYETGDVPDLTQVFGQRLVDYNAGVPVVLYDAYGANDSYVDDGTSAAYPPLCTTRYIAGQGAVSEWMFCTHYHSRVCGGTNAAGELTGFYGERIPGLGIVPRNQDLTADGVKIVSYLIENVHSYVPSTFFDFGATEARVDAGSNERVSLQLLIWCISDPVPPDETDVRELDRAALCEANMNDAEQKRILALVPDPVSALAFHGAPGAVAAGAVAEFDFTTNLYGDPLTVTITKGTGTLTVLSGTATLVGDQLTVSGADPLVPSVVRIGVTAAAASDIELTVAGVPSRQPRLSWYQSPGATAADKPCQVFAQFDEAMALRVSAVATTQRALAPTGLDAGMLLALAAAVTMLLLAFGALLVARRRDVTATRGD